MGVILKALLLSFLTAPCVSWQLFRATVMCSYAYPESCVCVSIMMTAGVEGGPVCWRTMRQMCGTEFEVGPCG